MMADDVQPLPLSEIPVYYNQGREANRLLQGSGQLEFARTQDLLTRYLPKPPAVIFDVGGGSGIYSLWLAKRGYEVHLIDLIPLHIEQAKQTALSQPDHPLASATVGDARQLDRNDSSVAAVLL